MNLIRKALNHLFPPKKACPPEEAEALRVEFQERYHNFKLLLNANNRSLEIMADIERALEGNHPFGMPFVRSHCTGAAVNVLRMIQNLGQLAPGKYEMLRDRFEDIRERIDAILARERSVAGEEIIIFLDNIDKTMSDLVGSKMAHIGEIKNKAGMRVPPGFVVTAQAHDRFMSETGLRTEINRLLQTTDMADIESLHGRSADIRQRIMRAELPPDIADAITSAWRKIGEKAGKSLTMAMRSSAFGEDSPDSSFAGQYTSELNVSLENAIDAYKTVVAGKYSLQAITYRHNRGFRDEDIPMSVGCLAMVDAVSGGVMYSRNPVDIGDDAIVVNAAWGLPKSVVDGSAACDHFVLPRNDPSHPAVAKIRKKAVRFVCFPDEGVCRLETSGDMAEKPSVDPGQLKTLAEIALKLETYYGSPQDIEWAADPDGNIWVLQCRSFRQKAPGTTTPETTKEDAEAVVARGGMTAATGVAAGLVFIVSKGIGTLRFPQGAVLVARQALPVWASLLSRAAAVVTEQGGVAGHLANVAREFGVPALFGLEGVADILKTGDLVTVDADGLTIYAGRRESLLQSPQAHINLMKGSPVHTMLYEASRHIIPLTLLDPGSHEFRPGNCQTLHDITRFVHEKSVHEMFNFGTSHDFPERSGKQLFYKVPMQWWVLNLDDGFKTEVTGKYVTLDNIVSVPMLAFWDGFAAVPWDGPPAMDSRGLLSVMFQSTVNPALNPGVRSGFAQRNFFMISKNYCSLSSRLGYHFSTVEALVGERDLENYAGFRFKGGAADMSRQIMRIDFIRDILEDYGFRVEAKNDLLSARIEGFDMDTMTSRLKILGYLSLHTRQLDMIMANPVQVNYYNTKIRGDIDGKILRTVEY